MAVGVALQGEPRDTHETLETLTQSYEKVMMAGIPSRWHWLMIDCAIAIIGLCLAILSPVALSLFPNLDQRIMGRAFILGLVIVGGALGTILYPE
jgi:hypothetical protein